MKRLLVILLVSACVLNGCGGKSKPSTPSVVEKIEVTEAVEPDIEQESEEEPKEERETIDLYDESFTNDYGDNILFSYYLSDGKKQISTSFVPRVDNNKDPLFYEILIYQLTPIVVAHTILKGVDGSMFAGICEGSRAGLIAMIDSAKPSWHISGGINRNGEITLAQEPDWFIELENVKHDEYDGDAEMNERNEWAIKTYLTCFDKIK